MDRGYSGSGRASGRRLRSCVAHDGVKKGEGRAEIIRVSDVMCGTVR